MICSELQLQRLGEGGDDVLDRLGADREPQKVGLNAAGGQLGAAGDGFHEIVVRDVDEGSEFLMPKLGPFGSRTAS